VIGDAVNRAKRLQSAAPTGTIYVGETTRQRAGDQFVWEGLDQGLDLKGLPPGIQAYRLVGVRESGPGLADSSLPFVGRERELSLLRAIASLAGAGEGQVVTVSGEAGVGKSRLIHEFSQELEDQGFRIVACVNFPGERLIAFHALGQVLRGALGIGPQSPTSSVVDRLAALGLDSPDEVARIQRILGDSSTPPDDDDAQERLRLTRRAVRHLLMSACEQQPCAFIIDGIQWADPASLDVLSHVVPWVSESAMLLIGALRQSGEVPWADVPHSRTISLERLSQEESHRLIDLAFGEGANAQGREAREAMALRSGGNPLFIRELTRSGAESEGQEIPGSIRDILMARMHGLRPGERDVLEIASVIGPRFSVGLASAAATTPAAQLRLVVEDLSQSAWIRQTSPLDADIYDFDHILARDVVYSSMLRDKRTALQRMVAEAIEVLGEITEPDQAVGENADLLAHHYAESDARHRAVPYLLVAMDRANERGACHSVAAHGTQLEELLATEDEAVVEKHALLMALGLYARACTLIGRNREALRISDEHQALAEELGALHELVRSRLWAGRAFLSMSRLDEAEHNLNAALELCRAQHDDVLATYALIGLASVQNHRGDREGALESFEGCLTAQGGGLPEALQAALHQGCAEICRDLGRLGAAVDHLTQAEALATQTDTPDPGLRAHINFTRARVILATGDLKSAVELARAARVLAGESGDPSVMADALIAEGHCLQHLGDAKAAIACLEQGLAAARDADMPGLAAAVESRLARVYCLMGEHETARSRAQQALQHADEMGEDVAARLARRVLADEAESQGLHEEAAELRLENARASLGAQRRMDEAVDRVELARSREALGELQRAEEGCAKALALARERGITPVVALAGRQLADIRLARHDHAGALLAAEEAAQAANRLDSAGLVWRTALSMARALEAGGDDEAAGTWFETMLDALGSVASSSPVSASAEGTTVDDGPMGRPSGDDVSAALEAVEEFMARTSALAHATERIGALRTAVGAR